MLYVTIQEEKRARCIWQGGGAEIRSVPRQRLAPPTVCLSGPLGGGPKAAWVPELEEEKFFTHPGPGHKLRLHLLGHGRPSSGFC